MPTFSSRIFARCRHPAECGGPLSNPIIAPRSVPAWAPAKWTQNFQAGHGWSIAGGNVGSSNLNDTSEFVRGTQSVSITTAGHATENGAGVDQANVQRLAAPALDLTGKAIRLLFKVSDVSKLRWISFYVGTANLANSFKWRVHTHTGTQNWVQTGEWVMVTLQWGDVQSASGAFSLSSSRVPSTTTGFTDMRFQVIDAGTGPVNVRLQSVELVDDTSVSYSEGLVSITFDDSWADVFDNGRPAMDTYGYRGTTYTIADQIGTTAKYTTAQLRAAQDLSGWEVAGHSHRGLIHEKRYDGVTADEVDTDAAGLRAWLVENGFHGDSFAYPGGRFGKTTDGVSVESIVARYFGTGRSIIAEDNREITPPPMPYRLRSLTGISSFANGLSNPANLAGPGGLLDRAQQSGGWLILCFHRVIDTAPTNSAECHRDDFAAIMRAINARGMAVLPVGEVIK
ncbi:polysaccharide deacetylase family protein [Micromonospora sp. WMMC415]|uniref:polysaccharide deacetylase family protein n=1 Tax=Micromonospora sp. WMMC415 TaxID=2675222 RepID=UPI0012B493AB|nr:polysaccharide deacetylase family protein [Micromonospora sp. WMMC415]QGN49767.1 polysaccharide deacetylase family protein [Micromonospora sp. WMMC415]